MRILIDLQACQSESSFRGIGRYSLSLALEMAKIGFEKGDEVSLLLNSSVAVNMAELEETFSAYVPKERLFHFSPPSNIAYSIDRNTWRAHASEVLLEILINQLNIDCFHVSSPFEGAGDDSVVSIKKIESNKVVSATVYDLIPLLMPDLYLTGQVYNEFYHHRIKSLKNADILLAISESSKKEVIENLPFEEGNITNISAAISSQFKVTPTSAEFSNTIKAKYGITKSFILYVPGGFDQRKNFNRLLEAYSSIDESDRKNFQLVIASKASKDIVKYFDNISQKLGIKSGQLVLTGYVIEEDLIKLYNCCHLNVFPSIHEGFGLPLLEGMGCGAPSIGSDTTSVPEVLGLSDALFDPFSVESIKNKLLRGLFDTEFRDMLKEHGLKQSKKFTWRSSAEKAMDFLESKISKVQSEKLKSIKIKSENELFKYLNEAIESANLNCTPNKDDLIELRNSVQDNWRELIRFNR